MSKEQYEALSAEFPKEAMTGDSSRGFALTSIKAQYVRERLNEVMGVEGWDSQTEVVKVSEKGDVAVRMTMTLRFKDGKVASRSAFGGADRKTKGQTFGDVFKSAETDALSKAASNFGVGNSVFKGLVDPKTFELKGAKSSSKSTTTTKSSNWRKPKAKTTTKTTTDNGLGDI
jgi:hypothetical protein